LANIVGIAAIVSLLAVAGLHLYWAAGGTWAASAAVPAREGRPLFRPTKAGTVLVAALFFLGAAVLSGRLGLFGRQGPSWFFRAGAWTLAGVFLARAIGDFRWIGFFKRHTGTRFAALDSALYSPLCFGLAVGCAVVALAGGAQ
jgi:hypothetical protein